MIYRNLLALEVEELLRSHPVDGAVLLGGCDKTTPAPSRCNVLGKSCGTVAPNVDLALKCVGYGYDFVAIASDLGFMMGAARSALNAVRVA